MKQYVLTNVLHKQEHVSHPSLGKRGMHSQWFRTHRRGRAQNAHDVACGV